MKLNAIDMFGESPTLQFSAANPKIHTKVGFFFTMVVTMIMVWYSLVEFDIMLSKIRKTYISSNYAVDLEALGDVYVKDYPQSFMYVFTI